MINLKCINCGAKLEISPEIEVFACGYCGSEQMVERKGGTVALKRVTDAISKVQVGTDKTAAELALKRLNEELRHVQAYRNQEMQRIEGERTGYIGICLLIIVLGLGVGVAGAVIASGLNYAVIGIVVLAAIVLIAVIVAVQYAVRKESEMKARLASITQKFNDHEAELRQRIAHNRAIANL